MRHILNEFRIIWKQRLSVFHYLNLVLLSASFALPFIAGSYSSETKKEELSNYIAERVKDSTDGGDIMAITVAATEKSGELPNDEHEFQNLYGVFRQNNATYASGYNLHKEINVTIPKLGSNTNYSIFYCAKDATIEYNGHYKHWYYPVEFMFPAQRLYDISHYMVYLSQSQANILLRQDDIQANLIDTNSLSAYESLIKKIIIITIDGSDYECVIGNIFYEQNYYYKALEETLQNFIMCAYYCPGNLFRENMYFLNSYPYQNTYFMNYVTQTYNNHLYKVSVLENNINRNIDTSYITSFYYLDIENDNVAQYILLLTSLLLIILVCIISFIKIWNKNTKYVILNSLVILAVYFIFFIISRITSSVLYLSDFGVRLYVYLLLYYFGSLLLLFVINKIYDGHQRKKTRICRE